MWTKTKTSKDFVLRGSRGGGRVFLTWYVKRTQNKKSYIFNLNWEQKSHPFGVFHARKPKQKIFFFNRAESFLEGFYLSCW